jgi:hypothetical protein
VGSSSKSLVEVIEVNILGGVVVVQVLVEELVVVSVDSTSKCFS